MSKIISMENYIEKKEKNKKDNIFDDGYIKLLKYLLSLSKEINTTYKHIYEQPLRVDICKYRNKGFKIRDHETKLNIKVSNKCEEFEINDYIVSNLLTIAPEHIYIYDKKFFSPLLIELLCRVFGHENIICEE